MDYYDKDKSEYFQEYKNQLFKGFKELRKYVDTFELILKVMMKSSDIPCFSEFDIKAFRERFKENYTDFEVDNFFKYNIIFFSKKLVNSKVFTKKCQL